MNSHQKLSITDQSCEKLVARRTLVGLALTAIGIGRAEIAVVSLAKELLLGGTNVADRAKNSAAERRFPRFFAL